MPTPLHCCQGCGWWHSCRGGTCARAPFRFHAAIHGGRCPRLAIATNILLLRVAPSYTTRPPLTFRRARHEVRGGGFRVESEGCAVAVCQYQSLSLLNEDRSIRRCYNYSALNCPLTVDHCPFPLLTAFMPTTPLPPRTHPSQHRPATSSGETSNSDRSSSVRYRSLASAHVPPFLLISRWR